MPEVVKILILALIQGITEFFPVSSSGHLVIFQKIMDLNIADEIMLDIFLHAGTLLSVFIFFRKDIKELLTGFRKKENIKFIGMVATASVPTAAIGLFFKKPLEALFHSPSAAGTALLFTGLFLLASRYLRLKKLNPYVTAFIIGTFQGIAIIPGLSRSGLTITVALVLLMGYEFSFRFSFLLSIPAILGATVLKMSEFSFNGDTGLMLTGFAASAVFGLTSLWLLRKIVLKETFHYFAPYCFLAGIVTLVMFN